MGTKRLAKFATLAVCTLLAFYPTRNARALENIVHAYQGIRASGMGGVKFTTGLYDENFFANPARVASNPKNRFTVFDLFLETTPDTISSATSLTGGGSQLSNVANTAGNNLHARMQTTMPAYYHPNPDGKFAWAIGLITSSQVDIDLRRSYQLDPNTIIDVGPAFTMAKRFNNDDSLSVGFTAHLMYRAATKTNFNLADFIKGGSFSPSKGGDDGGMLDFDLGIYKEFNHWTPADYRFSAGLAIDNILGGGFQNMPFHFVSGAGHTPVTEPTSVGFGVAVSHPTMWVFSDFVTALEFQDIGNNADGSIFRTIHWGAEGRWRKLRPRIGIYQGYPTLGVGLELKHMTLDFATYGEEMSLNSGGIEDRRIAFRIAFQI